MVSAMMPSRFPALYAVAAARATSFGVLAFGRHQLAFFGFFVRQIGFSRWLSGISAVEILVKIGFVPANFFESPPHTTFCAFRPPSRIY
jgi:hypothetical protein